MHHRRFFAALQRAVRKPEAGRPAVLDLGCGDGYPTKPLLQALDADRYVGVDQSTEALRRAEAQLKDVRASATLICADMPQAVAELADHFDLIIAGYSLHHLRTDDKAQVLRHGRRLLKAAGQLAVIDVFLDNGESRQSYLTRWEYHAREHFETLSPRELDTLVAHVRESDFPETVDAYARLAEEAGFAKVAQIDADPAGLNRLIICCGVG